MTPDHDSSRYRHVRIHLCESCGDGFEAGDEVVSLSDGYVDEHQDYDVSNRRFWHRDCFTPADIGSTTGSTERFEEVIRRARRSQYHDQADVLEYYADHDTNQFGPVYHPHDAPSMSPDEARRLLWAFRAGRALGPTEANHE